MDSLKGESVALSSVKPRSGHPLSASFYFDPVHDQVVLVEQFRMGPFLSNDDPWLLEVVAGISEPGETLEEVALREVEEETGYKITSLMPVSDFYVSPGASNEKLRLFCGLVDATDAGGIFGVADEGEDIRVHVLPFPGSL